MEEVDEKQLMEDLKKLEVQKQEKAKAFAEKLNEFLKTNGFGLVGVPYITQEGKLAANVSLTPLQPQ